MNLSTRRRHPLAGLVVVLLGLLVAGGLYSAFAPASADDSSSDTELIAAGRQLFVVGCSSCHGLNAEGIVEKNGTNYGPPLLGVGAAAVDFQVGTGRMPMARPDTQAPKKTPVYNDEEVAALAAYVASLSPGPSVPSAADIDPSDADVAAGFQLFLTNCTACHNYGGAGGALRDGRYAPNLYDVSAQHIWEAMVTGPQNMPVFSNAVITPQDKRDLIAYVQTLQDQTSYGGSSLGSRGPVTEGLFGWLVGIGSLVLVAVWIANNGTRASKKAT